MRASVAPGESADLLYGAPAIAAHLGLTDKVVYHLHGNGSLPTYKVGKKVCARRSELDAHFARASAAAKDVGSPPAATPDGGATLLYGHRAIAKHLRIPAGDVTRLDAERRLPTYQEDGCTVASTAALDHWNSMKGGL